MNSYVGMTTVKKKKKNRDKNDYFSLNIGYFSHYQPT